MRDVVITLLVLGALPFVVRKPFVGVLLWAWLGFMNPHRLCWGFAYGFPFAQIVAITLLGSLLVSKEPKKIPWTPISVLLLIFVVFMFITTWHAFNPDAAWAQWNKVWKIQLLTYVAMMLLTSKERIQALVAVIVVSLGFYGVKGGIFTLLTGGGYRVWGPAGSFISGNNEIGLALIMIMPLMRYFQLSSESKRIKRLAGVAMVFTMFSILATHSRGALLGLLVMAGYMVMKSRRKAPLILFMSILLVGGLLFMPSEWWQRMDTIETPEQDASAMQRINSWQTAFNIAKDNPIIGGGFETFTPFIFRLYAPNPNWVYDAHSIYFEIMGEHGFVGLALFLIIGLTALREAKKIVRETASNDKLRWMGDLAAMIHVSLVGYAVSGLFLGLAYFDLYYSLLAILVGMRRVLDRYKTSGILESAAATSDSIPTVPENRAQRTVVGRFKRWYEKL